MTSVIKGHRQPDSLPWVTPKLPSLQLLSGSVGPASASSLMSILSDEPSLPLLIIPHQEPTSQQLTALSGPWESAILQLRPLQSVEECQPVSSLNAFPFPIILALLFKSQPLSSPPNFQSWGETVNANTGVLKRCRRGRLLSRHLEHFLTNSCDSNL